MNGWILLSIYFSSGVGGKLNLHFPLMYNVVIIIYYYYCHLGNVLLRHELLLSLSFVLHCKKTIFVDGVQ